VDARPLGFIVQRYGEEVVGGSEALCRIVAEMLAAHRPVDVLTSCARDYLTWQDEYPAGASELNGVTIHRFPVDFQRDQTFHKVFDAILGGMRLETYPWRRARMRRTIARSLPELQLACLKLQGPYSTPLLDYLHSHHQDYDLLVFLTYLYPTTFFGSLQVPAEKTILVPTAHDEAPIHFPVFQEMFARFPAFVFLTPEERRFVEETFDVKAATKATIGMPVELTQVSDAQRFRQTYEIRRPFLLYAGRADSSKGCDELFRFFLAAQPYLPADLELILIGKLAMDMPDHPSIRHLGMLPEHDKADAMAAATIVVNPSPFESFSIVILEAMLCGTPVLVNGQCSVLKGQVRRSSGGLYYETYSEFVETLQLLLDNEILRKRLGANGRRFVEQNYSNDRVKQRYLALLQQLEVTY
jgi:glycosyltransferase involved in cell wall biosynthesis